MNTPATTLALSALSLVESLLLELREKGVIEEHDMAALLHDVISAHNQAAIEGEESTKKIHLRVADVVRQFGAGGHSVRVIEQLQADSGSSD